MALGDYPAGEGPAGFDPVMASSRVAPVVPKALYIDLEKRTVLYDANGYAKAMHPVDQTMAICCGIKKGTLTSSPDDGLDVDRILQASLASRQSVAEDAVNVAAAGPIGRGDVTIRRVLASTGTGQISLIVDYRNNRTAVIRTVSLS
jgi:hypothetical protein